VSIGLGILLAQSGGTRSAIDAVVIIGILIGAAVVLGAAIVFLRSRLLADQRDDLGAGVMEQLRRALREGEMTQEEFDAAKRSLVARISDPRQNPDNAPPDPSRTETKGPTTGSAGGAGDSVD